MLSIMMYAQSSNKIIQFVKCVGVALLLTFTISVVGVVLCFAIPIIFLLLVVTVIGELLTTSLGQEKKGTQKSGTKSNFNIDIH